MTLTGTDAASDFGVGSAAAQHVAAVASAIESMPATRVILGPFGLHGRGMPARNDPGPTKNRFTKQSGGIETDVMLIPFLALFGIGWGGAELFGPGPDDACR
ncbi:MAG: hypothetical protein AB1646_09680 [Thermodesulfobacteriota bacterium]